MKPLEKIYHSLKLFSDIDWPSVNEEFETSFKDLSFPEYLQQKSLDGDCPSYLFELAFYEYATNELESLKAEPLSGKGLHLNPTTFFLSLEFDVIEMLKEAEKGNIEIVERHHVLCLYKNLKGNVCSYEVNEKNLEVLQLLENGPLLDKTHLNEEEKEIFDLLIHKDLVLSERNF